MKPLWIILATLIFASLLSVPMPRADDDGRQFPRNATFTTLITTPRSIEGLTGNHTDNLYVGGSGAAPCPIWKINLRNPSLTVIGNIPVALAATCAFSGIALDALNNLYQADGTAGRIYTFTPNAGSPPNATIFASGVPGTNGLAFDEDGNLWTGDGVTGQGRVWKITGAGANCASAPVNCEEVFRIQPLANEVNLDSTGAGGVGRDVRTLPTGTITVTGTSRNAANTLNSQPLVANGIAFNRKGTMFIIDTARGALWKVEFDRHGNLKSPTGCDSTFTDNTLCLSNVFVAHPILEGGDGIALDREGNIWVDANERNAVAVVTEDGQSFYQWQSLLYVPVGRRSERQFAAQRRRNQCRTRSRKNFLHGSGIEDSRFGVAGSLRRSRIEKLSL